jgi:hypothetical protein
MFLLVPFIYSTSPATHLVAVVIREIFPPRRKPLSL